jgi:integrase
MAESKLTAKKVAATKKPGRLSDGGGLYLQTTIGKDGKTIHQSWVYRFQIGGREREMGLGALAADNWLAEARTARNKWRAFVKQGRDPIIVREQERQAAAFADSGTKSFAAVFDDYLADNRHIWRSPATEIDWKGQFDTHVLPVIGKLAAADVRSEHIDRILKPLWQGPIRGQLLRQRLEAVFDSAIALGYRTAENPARLRRVKHAMAKRPRYKKTNLAAMPLTEVAGFVARLRVRQAADPADPSPWALELLVQTGVRVGQIRMMRWREVDLATATWASPGAEWDAKGKLIVKGNTKSGRNHRVALNDRAMTILRAQPGEHRPDDLVFAGAKSGAPMGKNTVRIWAKQHMGMTVTLHGFRSCFRDWVATQTKFARELAEFALDHRHREVVGDRTELAYMRDDLLEKRRPLMRAWGAFLDRPIEAATVTPIRPMAVAAG